MSALSQISSIAAMNLRSVPQRLGASLVIAIGIAGVVAVMLSMPMGLRKTISGTRRDDRAIVVRTETAQEMSSAMSRAQGTTIMDAPGVKKNAEGKPIASAETLTVLDLPTADGSWANVMVRGVGSQALELRPELKIVQGQMFRPAVNELIIGSKTMTQFPSGLMIIGILWACAIAPHRWPLPRPPRRARTGGDGAEGDVSLKNGCWWRRRCSRARA